MKILITGGKGTVGQFLSTRLPYEIYSPGKDELNLNNAGEVSQYLDQHKFDVVIHCALTGRENLFSSSPYYTTDSLWMFRNLWNNKDKFKKLINLATAYEFDLTRDNTEIHEYDVLKYLPNTSYGYAKNIITRIVRETPNFFNLRLFGVFHEEEADKRFFKKLLIDKKIEINNDVYFDYFYLGDIIPAINSIIKGQNYFRDMNMVYPKKYKMSELAKLFCVVHSINPDNVVVLGNNGLNLTGSSRLLDMHNFDLLGLEQGFKLYKI